VADLLNDIGYPNHYGVVSNIVGQSPDIARGVDTGGAGDQGIMYGYATDETPELMPLGTVLVHKLTRGLEDLRRRGTLRWLRPDGKAEVTMAGGRVAAVLVSCQHDEAVGQETVRQALTEHLIQPTVGDLSGVTVLVNPTGKFVRGGFDADTGMTGRKLMVDTYGGLVPHGGGCFSGKDPTKVDRSAAYLARLAAKSVVASGHAKECLVAVAYAIGVAEPLMLEAVDETGQSLTAVVKKTFDFRPQAIIERLDLKRTIYRPTAAYGHFGRPEFPWEQTVAL
jgi:S-adenosylmethionine synthetase